MKKLLFPISPARASIPVWNQLTIWIKEIPASLDVLQILPEKFSLPQMPGPGHYPFKSFAYTPPHVSIASLCEMVDINDWEIAKGNTLTVVVEHEKRVKPDYIVIDLATMPFEPNLWQLSCETPLVIIPPNAAFRSWNYLDTIGMDEYEEYVDKEVPFLLNVAPELEKKCTCGKACLKSREQVVTTCQPFL